MNKKIDESHRDEVVRYITSTHDVKKIANVIKTKNEGYKYNINKGDD